MAEDYIKFNKANWDERAPEVRHVPAQTIYSTMLTIPTSIQHAKSPNADYGKLLKDPTHLSDVARFDTPLLPDVTGLDIIHLQCHIATDTISLARRGAKSVVGLDFSPASLKEARRLAENAAGGEKLSFVEASAYDALTVLQPASFDLLFTGIGALCWLPDIRKWAHIVASLLKPGGRLFLREAHPIMWTLDEKVTSHLHIHYSYFERPEPMTFEDDGTYMELADKETKFTSTKTLEWNHALSEIVQSLLDEGMMISGFVEHKSVPWEALPGQMNDMGNGRFDSFESGGFECWC